jgi:zinc metalloprotease ZmpB
MISRRLYILATLLLLAGTNLLAQQTTKTSSSEAESIPAIGNTTFRLYGTYAGAEVQKLPVSIREALAELQSEQTGIVQEHVKYSPIGTHILFRQTYQGYPVHGATIKVNLAKDGTVMNALSAAKAIQPSTIASQSKLLSELAQIAERVTGGAAIKTSWMVWVDENAKPVLCANVLMKPTAAMLQTRELLLDAKTGEVHLNLNLTSGAGVDGTGYCFRPDPLTSAQVPYGTPYSDNNDANNAELTAELITIVLRDLDTTGGVYSLNGPYVKIEDIEAPAIAPPTSANGQFNYDRSQPGFEAVNIYYHIDAFQRYIQSLGFDTLGDRPIRVDPHGNNGSDNSYFQPLGLGSNYLSFGDGGIDDGEDADVVVHEYTHDLSYTAATGTNTGTQRRGFDEGISDYFAFTYSRRINPYNWQKVFSWDGNTSSWLGRTVTTTNTYFSLGSFANVYDYGELISGSLAIVWGEIGYEKTDKIALASLFFSNSNMSVPDAACNLLKAENQLFGGAYKGKLQSAFSRFGINPPASCSITATENILGNTRFEVYPNPARESISLVLPEVRDTEFTLRLLDVTGRTVFQTKVSSLSPVVDLPSLNAGLYVAQLQNATGIVATTKVMIRP